MNVVSRLGARLGYWDRANKKGLQHLQPLYFFGRGGRI